MLAGLVLVLSTNSGLLLQTIFTQVPTASFASGIAAPTSSMEHLVQASTSSGPNIMISSPLLSNSAFAVSTALQANEAHRAALNAKRAQLKKELQDAAVMLETVDKDVDPRLEEVKVKDLDEWAVFAAAGASTQRPLLSTKQINAEVRLMTASFFGDGKLRSCILLFVGFTFSRGR